MFHTRHAIAVVILSVALPVGLAAQQRSAAPGAQRPAAAAPQQRAAAPSQAQMQQWMDELRRLDARLGEIQAKAIQDPQLQAAQSALGTEVKAALEKADPQLSVKLQRGEALEAEAARAHQAGDQAKLQRLTQEAQALQASLLQTQARVFQQPGMAAKLDAFQTRLEARMTQIDAESPALIKRFRELENRLAAGMQAHQQR